MRDELVLKIALLRLARATSISSMIVKSGRLLKVLNCLPARGHRGCGFATISVYAKPNVVCELSVVGMHKLAGKECMIGVRTNCADLVVMS